MSTWCSVVYSCVLIHYKAVGMSPCDSRNRDSQVSTTCVNFPLMKKLYRSLLTQAASFTMTALAHYTT